MNSVGIDISKGRSTVAVMSPFGEAVISPFEARHTDSELSELAKLLKSLGGETRVVMEATGNYHTPVAWLLHNAGLYVSVVNAKLVHGYRNNDLRRVKTDKKDAVKLANYGLDRWLTLPRLRIKIEQSERLQQLSTTISAEREKLQAAKQREKAKTTLIEKIQFLRKAIIQSQEKFLKAYESYCTIVIQTGTKISAALSFSAIPVWKQKSFQSELSNIFDNRNYPSFKSQYNYDLMLLASDDYNEALLDKLWEAMSNP